MSDITRLLDAAASGDRKAAAELLPLVYDELRKLAGGTIYMSVKARVVEHEGRCKKFATNGGGRHGIPTYFALSGLGEAGQFLRALPWALMFGPFGARTPRWI